MGVEFEQENKKSLLNQSAKGVKWSMFASIFNMVAQIAYTSVMAYLLDPIAFGIMAIASVVVDFGRHVSNMGIGQAVVQKQDLNRNDIRAAFTFSLGLGLIIYLIIFLTSDYIALFYEKPEISSILQYLGISLVFVSISIPSRNLLRREMRFKELSIVGSLNFLFAYVAVGVISAYQGFGVWSLVFANIISKITLAISFYLLTRHSILLSFKWSHYRPILAYGSMMTVNTLSEFAYQNVSSLFIGKFSSIGGLGLFSRAHMLVYLPTRNISTNLGAVAFPAFSKVQNNLPKLKEGYLSIISVISLIILPLTLGMMAGAEEIVRVILGPQWLEAIPIFRVLSFTIGISMVTTFSGIVCDSTANLRNKLWLNISFVLVLIISLGLALPWGLIGFTWALFFTEIFRNISYGFLMNRIIKVGFQDYFNIYFPSIAIGMYVGMSIYGIKLLLTMAGFSTLLILLGEMFIGGIALVSGIYFLPQSALKYRLQELMIKLKLDRTKNPYLKKLYQLYAKSK